MKKSALIAIFSILFLTLGQNSFAEAVPQFIVNHETKECAEFIPSDECIDCFADEGWEAIGPVSENECPQGYAEVEYVPKTIEEIDRKVELMDRKDVIDYILYTIVFAVAVAVSLVILWFLFRRKSKK